MIKYCMQTHTGSVALACILYFVSCILSTVYAHHVLGRPSYSLGEDSNTPPSMQVETQIGDYYITYMVFPAFPKPNQNGRVNLYAKRIDNGDSFKGKVTFTVRDDSWFGAATEVLGTQEPYDHIFRQGFIFSEKGDYIISAQFESGGEPYAIDFPLRVGEPIPIGPIGVSVVAIVLILVLVNILQRRRLQRLKASRHHAEVEG